MLNCLTIYLKRSLWDKKSTWIVLSLENMMEQLKSNISLKGIHSGNEGIYLSSYATDEQGNVYYLLWLDVEHPDKHHSSIQSNIEIAQELFIRLAEMSLTDDLTISLTGNGFRFSWPYIISPPLCKAFQYFIKDQEIWPGIDPSPQIQKSFFRVAAYRGNPRQNKNTIDAHIKFLPQASEIFDLDESKYWQLTRGKPDNPEMYFQDLKRVIPSSIGIPEAWKSLFMYYESIIRLRSHIVKIGFNNNQACYKINWDSIYNYLGELGISITEVQFSNTEIYRLSECPECGKNEGSPFITNSGRLKCFRASCRGSEVRTDNNSVIMWAGLSPSEWVVGYSQHYDDIQVVDITSNELCSIETARERIKEAISSV